MGKKLHEESVNDNKLFKSEIDLDSLKAYSSGIDLAYFLIGVPDIHSLKKQDFLLSLIQYVKENNLIEDKEILAFLYGLLVTISLIQMHILYYIT